MCLQGQPNEAVAQAVSQLKSGEVDLGHKHIRRVVVHTHSANIGVASSWNQVMLEEQTAAYWLLTETDVIFAAGALAEVAHKMRYERSVFALRLLLAVGGRAGTTVVVYGGLAGTLYRNTLRSWSRRRRLLLLDGLMRTSGQLTQRIVTTRRDSY